jgi:hypothetical protein
MPWQPFRDTSHCEHWWSVLKSVWVVKLKQFFDFVLFMRSHTVLSDWSWLEGRIERTAGPYAALRRLGDIPGIVSSFWMLSAVCLRVSSYSGDTFSWINCFLLFRCITWWQMLFPVPLLHRQISYWTSQQCRTVGSCELCKLKLLKSPAFCNVTLCRWPSCWQRFEPP